MKLKLVKEEKDYSDDSFDDYYFLFDRPCKCTVLCCCRPEIEIKTKNGSVIGKVVEPFTCCSPCFKIYNAQGIITYSVLVNCCQCIYLCNCKTKCSIGKLYDGKFEIYDGDYTTGTPVGFIEKKSKGCAQMVSVADSYLLRFPPKASSEDRISLLAAAIMIDYRYYED